MNCCCDLSPRLHEEDFSTMTLANLAIETSYIDTVHRLG